MGPSLWCAVVLDKQSHSRQGAGSVFLFQLWQTRRSQNPNVPGWRKDIDSTILQGASSLVQYMAPLKSIHSYVNALHCYCGQVSRQVEAHHYCAHLNEDFHQCVIYDGNGPEARLIGIEYIVSHELFKTFPEEEKKFWHSHAYEVGAFLSFFRQLSGQIGTIGGSRHSGYCTI